ncbi:hypothetical protein [Clostridium grantii]|nr:hypothetical protein [Clostridium grantii]
MDISYIAATVPDEPIAITSIESINNKTITVILNQPFTGNEDFEVFQTDNPLEEVHVIAVVDSINPSNDKKVLVAYNSLLPDEDYVFQTGVNYTLKITKDTEIISSFFSVTNDLPKPLNGTVTAVGNRILNIEFDTPILHLDYINTDDNLANFYLLLYNLDTNVSLDANPNWMGLFSASTDDSTSLSTVRKSDDFKSLEIQMNFRGLPIGNHGLVFNYSKSQSSDYHYYLHDFSDDHVIVPSMKREFNISTDAITANPIQVVALDRTNLIVTFDKAVIKKHDEVNVISVNGATVPVSKVLRVGNQFNQLQFVLNNANPLPIGLIDVTIGRITDANGYLTPTTTFNNIPVVVTLPRIIDVDQFEDSQTKIIVTFSKDMKDTDGAGGIRNTSYYTITTFEGTSVNPISPIVYDSINRTATLEVAAKLDAGAHVLSAIDIEDIYELPMLPQSVGFTIIDTSVPVVESVTYRERSVVVKFDESMLAVGEHSTTNTANYLIASNVLPYETTSFPMKENRWIRLTLPETASVLPLGDIVTGYSTINIGYPKLKEVRYIENLSGNIYPLCKINDIVGPIEEIDISNGTVTVLTTEVLQYKYTGTNELYNVDVNDFDITLNGEIITPLYLELVDDKTIKFVFAANTFNGGSTDVVVYTKAEVNYTIDIYGLPLKPDAETLPPAINGLRANIEGISLVSNDSTSALLRMSFNKPIAHFEKNDFICVLNDSSVLSILSAAVVLGTDSQVFQLNIGLTQAFTMLDKLDIRLAVPDYLIRTMDFNNNRIAVFTPKEATTFLAESIIWNKPTSATTLASNKIQIDFSSAINPGSLIPHSSFDDTVNDPWDGLSPLTITPGNLVFTKGASEDSITVMNNPMFGSIILENTILIADTINTSNVTLTLLDERKIVLDFASDEAAPLDVENINLINYTPYMDPENGTLMDKDNIKFLYVDYKPEGSISNV